MTAAASTSAALRRVLLAGVGAAASQLPVAAPAGRRRLLVLRPDHLGDVLLTTPALALLRASHPDAEIVALVGPWAAAALRGNPHVDRLLAYAYPWFDRREAGLAVRYAAAGALATRMRALGVHRAYVLRPDHWWGAMALALAGVPERVGYADAETHRFLTCRLRPPDGEHVTRSAIRLVAGAEVARQVRPGQPPTVFVPSAEDRRSAAAALGPAHGWPTVVVHPGASTPLKRWPGDRWREVVAWLRARGAAVWVVGGPGEEAVVAEIAAGGVDVLAPLRSLGLLGAVLERADLAIGMDSAPMHVATAVGTPTLRLAGPADERLFGPWGDPARHVVVRAAGTEPDPDWFGGATTAHPTLLALQADVVLAEVERLLGTLG